MSGFAYIPSRSDGTTLRPLVVGQVVQVTTNGNRQTAWVVQLATCADGTQAAWLRCSDGSRIVRSRASVEE